MIFLSICIPTYNRAPFLKNCLESIVSQFADEEVFRRTEIIVSDNASSDGTEIMVKKYQERWPNIRYYRNSENVGFDRNVLSAVDKAEGEYCWLLGDDDAMFENSLKSALSEIESSRCDYYMANFWAYDRELLNPALNHPHFNLSSNMKYECLSDFVRTIKSYKQLLGFSGGMSVQIFRRKIWQDFSDKAQFIGSECIHSPVLQLVMKDRSFMILKEPLVKARSGNIRWETFPGIGTLKQRIAKCRQGLIWTLNLFDMPISKWRINFFFLEDTISELFKQWCKNRLAGYPKLYDFTSKCYKKLFAK